MDLFLEAQEQTPLISVSPVRKGVTLGGVAWWGAAGHALHLMKIYRASEFVN